LQIKAQEQPRGPAGRREPRSVHRFVASVKRGPMSRSALQARLST
jgi:hypothetical protein